MSRHTPGPWTFDGENECNQGFDVALPDGGVSATAYYDVDRDADSVRQAEANARLIAAAPEMYEALKVVAEWEGDKAPPLAMVRQWAADARAAVAKAEGG
jgi:hypothetical protein